MTPGGILEKQAQPTAKESHAAPRLRTISFLKLMLGIDRK